VVINELAVLPDQIALVMDDYHLIEAPMVSQSLAYLLERLPSSLQLLFSTRSDHPLPLARLRAGGQLVELREAELRFAVQETAELLREATGLDFPGESVLARQPDELVQFLLETSVLDRLSGPLCDAVCGRTDSQQLLEGIERANLFLVPLDDVRRWWRYHHLFGDLLQARLQQANPRSCDRAAPRRGRLVRGARPRRRCHPPRTRRRRS
jgi:ATP/maltotriose-dependent transcriptional regulator MalT